MSAAPAAGNYHGGGSTIDKVHWLLIEMSSLKSLSGLRIGTADNRANVPVRIW